MGLDQTPVEKRGPVQALPLITGAYGGHTIDFREFAARGITLLGRIEGMREHTIEIAPDLAANLHAGDMAYEDFLNRVDAHIEDRAVAVPVDPAARVRRPDPTCVNEPIRQLTLKERRRRCRDLVYRLPPRLQLDRPTGTGCPRHAAAPARHSGAARALFPRLAVAIEDEFVFLVWGRR